MSVHKLKIGDINQLYDEVTVFLTIVLFCFFLLILPQSLMDSFMEFFRKLFILTCMALILVLIIIANSVFAVFSRKKIHKETKKGMAKFVFIFVFIINCLIVYSYLQSFSLNFFILIPTVNTGILILQGIRLLILGRVNEQMFYEKQPKAYDFSISSCILCIIFFLCHFVFRVLWIDTISFCLLFIFVRKDIFFWFLQKMKPNQESTKDIDVEISPIPYVPLGIIVLTMGLLPVSFFGLLKIVLFFRPFFISTAYTFSFFDLVFYILMLIVIILFLLISIGFSRRERIYWKIAVGLFSLLCVIQFLFIAIGLLNPNTQVFSVYLGVLSVVLIPTFVITCLIIVYLLQPRIKKYFFQDQ